MKKSRRTTPRRTPAKSQTWQVLHSSARDDWETPRHVYEALEREFGPFALDAAAAAHNRKCDLYLTKEEDALTKDWSALASANGAEARVWLNPPYGRGLEKWVRKARIEAGNGCTVVCILPASTSTKWFHDIILASGAEVRFHRGRLHFCQRGVPGNAAPMDTMVVIFRPDAAGSDRDRPLAEEAA